MKGVNFSSWDQSLAFLSSFSFQCDTDIQGVFGEGGLSGSLGELSFGLDLFGLNVSRN